MSENKGTTAEVQGGNKDYATFKFVHQPSDRKRYHNPGEILAPNPVIQLTGKVDQLGFYSATAVVVPEGKNDTQGLEARSGTEQRMQNGIIRFSWDNLSADGRGWFYVEVTLAENIGNCVKTTTERSKRFDAGAP